MSPTILTLLLLFLPCFPYAPKILPRRTMLMNIYNCALSSPALLMPESAMAEEEEVNAVKVGEEGGTVVMLEGVVKVEEGGATARVNASEFSSSESSRLGDSDEEAQRAEIERARVERERKERVKERVVSGKKFKRMMLLMRAEESVGQELNLLNTGKYKTLQRANVKLALRSIINNYDLLDSFAALDDGRDGGLVGQEIVGDLRTMLEYFDDGAVDSLDLSRVRRSRSGQGVAAPDIEPGKKKILILGLEKVKSLFSDYFATYADRELVEVCRDIIEEEDKANREEYEVYVNGKYENGEAP